MRKQPGSTSRKKSPDRPDRESLGQGMVLLAGGTFIMGSDRFYPEERPSRQVRVPPFWIDETPVTNSKFHRFVEETGYVTLAEKAPDPKDYPGLLPEFAHAGVCASRLAAVRTSRGIGPSRRPGLVDLQR